MRELLDKLKELKRSLKKFFLKQSALFAALTLSNVLACNHSPEISAGQLIPVNGSVTPLRMGGGAHSNLKEENYSLGCCKLSSQSGPIKSWLSRPQFFFDLNAKALCKHK